MFVGFWGVCSEQKTIEWGIERVTKPKIHWSADATRFIEQVGMKFMISYLNTNNF